MTPFANNPPGVFTPSLNTTATPATLTIAANPTGQPVGTYQGSFTIASNTSPNTPSVVVTMNLVVTNGCCLTVTPTSVSLTNAVPADGSTPITATGSFTVNVSGGLGPSWTASSSVPWLTIPSGSSGSGASTNGTYSALSNPTTSSRTGVITVTPLAGVPAAIQFTQPGSTAPLLDREVTALYQTILGRDPDAAGYTFWTGSGTAGLGQMADSFFTSPEAFNSDFAVLAAYQAATGAPPTFAQFLPAVAAAKSGAQVLPELFSALAAGNPSYTITTLYHNLLGRNNTEADAACASTGIAACFQTLIGYPATATPVNTPGSEFQHSGPHTNALYITLLYFTILDRDPDTAGFAFWSGIADGGGPGLAFQGSAGFPTRLQILGPGTPGQGFIGSQEFQAKFQ